MAADTMQDVHGVILAGGTGTRLRPVTHLINKHLLPVYDKPMIYYPLEALAKAGVRKVVVVTHEQYIAQFKVLLGDGSQFGIELLEFAVQAVAAGVADALKAAQPFVIASRMCVMLGDNIVGGVLRDAVDAFRKQDAMPAMVLLREVCDPCAFGVARFDDKGNMLEIVEKPDHPAPSNLAVTGVYFYDKSVFDVCSTLQPSARGELEITGVNNHYIQHGQMDWLALHCWWSDVGTFEGIRDATELVRRFGANQEGNGSAGRGLHLAGDHGAAADGFLCSSAAAPRSTGMADQALRVLVTGGSGFIGSHFVRLLLHTRPAWSVANFDLLTYAGRANNLRDVEHMPNYTFIQGDVRDVSAVGSAVADCDIVVHFAAESHVDRSIADAQPFITTNVQGTQNLIDACRRTGSVKRFVYVSTDEVYGTLPLDRPDVVFYETSPFSPTSPYAASKAAGDLLVQAAFKTYGFDAVITRSSNNFGTHQYPEKVIPLFVTNLLEGQTIPLYGDGLNVRDWVHVVDNCEGILAALECGIAGEAYNIGGSNECSNRELTMHILAACGADASRIQYVTDRLGHDRRYAMDCTKARKELGFMPRRSTFPDALIQIVEWYRANAEWWRPLKSGVQPPG